MLLVKFALVELLVHMRIFDNFKCVTVASSTSRTVEQHDRHEEKEKEKEPELEKEGWEYGCPKNVWVLGRHLSEYWMRNGYVYDSFHPCPWMARSAHTQKHPYVQQMLKIRKLEVAKC